MVDRVRSQVARYKHLSSWVMHVQSATIIAIIINERGGMKGYET